MKLAQASVLNGLAVASKVGTQLVLNKLLAVYVGPAGFGVVGQFQNLIAIVTLLCSGSISNGVVKYTSEHRDDPALQADLWRTALTLAACVALVVAALLAIVRDPLSAWAVQGFGSGVIVALGVAAVPTALNGMLLAILNGLQRVKAHVTASIGGSVLTALWIFAMLEVFRLQGALYALATSQAVAFIVTWVVFRRQVALSWRRLVGRIDPVFARKLGSYAIMGVTTAIVFPVSQILMRNGVANALGWESAGHWQAMVRISETHLLLLTTTLSLYFLPRYAQIQQAPELRREIVGGYRFVLPLVAVTAAMIYALREPLIVLLLSDQFLPVADVMAMQLVGDVLKVGSWVLAFTMVSHAMTRTFVATEIGFGVLQVALTYLLVHRVGLVGAAYGYAITYAVYWLAMLFVVRGLMVRLRPS